MSDILVTERKNTMNTVTLNSMAFDNFETLNDTLLADFDGAGVYSAVVGGIDRGFEWGPMVLQQAERLELG